MLPRKSLTRKWTDGDAAKLVELSKAGATLARAAGALSRNTSSVQKGSGARFNVSRCAGGSRGTSKVRRN